MTKIVYNDLFSCIMQLSVVTVICCINYNDALRQKVAQQKFQLISFKLRVIIRENKECIILTKLFPLQFLWKSKSLSREEQRKEGK